MSMQDVEGFAARVMADPGLQSRLDVIRHDYVGDKQNPYIMAANIILPTARMLGYRFTIREYLAFAQSAVGSDVEKKGEALLFGEQSDVLLSLPHMPLA